MSYPLPVNEHDRLRMLRSLHILDTHPESAYDDIVQLAASICQVPIALVSLVDGERQWFKARHGLCTPQTPREIAFCAHAICRPAELLLVEDTLADPRFAGNPLVTGSPHVRFYAGAPLVTATGEALGTLCVFDRQPRQLSELQQQTLRTLARNVVGFMELRKTGDELKLANARLAALSMCDGLTGVANRRALDLRLSEEVARARRYDSPCSLMMVDLDQFRQLNDCHGHVAADDALKQMAAVLREAARETDLIARYGAAEFAVVLPDTEQHGALIVAQRYLTHIDHHHFDIGPLSASIGVATLDPDQDDAPALLAQADMALYQAKRNGSDRICYFEGGNFSCH